MNALATRPNDHTIQFVRILPGPIEKVWTYLADSDKRGEWFARGKLPDKVGEDFELVWKHSELSPHSAAPPDGMENMDKNGHRATQTMLKYEPPHLLAFTFGKPDGEKSLVEFRLEDMDDNKVRLTLTHSKIPDEGYRLGVSGGWHSHLDILQDRVEGKVPPAFWDVWRQNNGLYK